MAFPVFSEDLDMVRCEYCSQRIDDGINVCPYCGAPLPVPDCSQVSGEVPSDDTVKAENEADLPSMVPNRQKDLTSTMIMTMIFPGETF